MAVGLTGSGLWSVSERQRAQIQIEIQIVQCRVLTGEQTL
jgi:hypothetical protein